MATNATAEINRVGRIAGSAGTLRPNVLQYRRAPFLRASLSIALLDATCSGLLIPACARRLTSAFLDHYPFVTCNRHDSISVFFARGVKIFRLRGKCLVPNKTFSDVP